ncbi:MAG: hypothetical protein K6L80_00475 [Agarilytica sp.]
MRKLLPLITASTLAVFSVQGLANACYEFETTHTYDTNGFIDIVTKNGAITDYDHNSRGLQIQRIEAVGTTEERTITTQWHADYRLPEFITSPGRTVDPEYNANGQVISRTVTDTDTSESRTWTYDYCSAGEANCVEGLLKNVDGPRTDVTDVTTYQYNTDGTLKATVNALGHTSQILNYDDAGRPLTVEDANGVQTILSYTPRGWLETRTTEGATTTFTYDAVGNVDIIKLPNNTYLDYDYDDANRLTDIADNAGNTIHYGLNLMGGRELTQISDSNGVIVNTQSAVFDNLNRLFQSIGASSQTVEYAYDEHQNLDYQIDPQTQRLTDYGYDALNRLIAVTAAQGSGEEATTLTTYDQWDNVHTVTDAEGNVTTYTYNALGDLKELDSPDTGITTFTYDEAGNRETQTDARGITATYTYDALNRLINISYLDASENLTYVYDTALNGIGRLAAIQGESSNIDYAYDPRGTVQSETHTLNGTLFTPSYQYDIADNLEATTYPSGLIVTYNRNALGQVDSVTADNNGTQTILASNITYLPFGPMQTLTYGNGLVTTKTFDQDYRLDTQSTDSIQSLDLDYDNANNIQAITDLVDAGKTQGFTYDDLHRLSTADGTYGDQGFDYDLVGNRTQLNQDGNINTYAISNNSNRIDAVTGVNPITYQYDTVGNTTQKDSMTFDYNQANRMKTAKVNGVAVGEYQYNALGQRVQKVASGETILFHYDLSGQLIAETNAQGDISAEYVYLDGMRLATYQNGGSAAPEYPTVVSRTNMPLSTWFTNSLTGLTADYDLDISSRVLHLELSDGTVRDITFADDGVQWVKTEDTANDVWRVDFNAFSVDEQYRVYGNLDLKYSDGDKFLLTVKKYTNYFEEYDMPAQGNNVFTQGGVTLTLDQVTNYAKIERDGSVIFDGTVPAGYWYGYTYMRNGSLVTSYGFNYHDGVKAMQANASHHDGVHDWEAYILLNGETGPDSGSSHDQSEFFGASGQSQSWYYLHTNHLDAVTHVTDTSGDVVYQADYTPFGGVSEQINTLNIELRFPGQYRDEETGLYYNWNRYYDAETGRYITSDPIGLNGGINTYGYVGGNPVGGVDPMGLYSGVPNYFRPGNVFRDNVQLPVSDPRVEHMFYEYTTLEPSAGVTSDGDVKGSLGLKESYRLYGLVDPQCKKRIDWSSRSDINDLVDGLKVKPTIGVTYHDNGVILPVTGVNYESSVYIATRYEFVDRNGCQCDVEFSREATEGYEIFKLFEILDRIDVEGMVKERSKPRLRR